MPHFYTHTKDDLKELNELGVGQLGVVNKNSSAAMSDTAKILVVGLGGMGLATVHRLKKTLIGRIGDLRESDIQFLAFDTSIKDLNGVRAEGPLTIAETPHLHSPSLRNIMEQEAKYRPVSFNAPLPPPNKGFNPTFAGQGAGQYRLTGRLTIMDNSTYNETINHLRGAISRLGDFTQRTLEIHVICGVGGGTGSGLCVDMPYIIRHVTEMLHISKTNVRMFGHVYLPNTYDTAEKDGVNLSRAYRNGYAALKEIDYYMNIRNVYETYDSIYPDGPYSTTSPIFDICTLIGGHSSKDIVIQDTKDKAITTCVENLINQVTNAVSVINEYDKDKNGSLADIFTSDAFRDNVNGHLSTVFQNGLSHFHESGNYHYNYVGSSSLTFPAESIIEYFIGNAVTKTIDQLEKNTSFVKQTDVDAFAKGIISPVDLIKPAMDSYEQRAMETIGGAIWNKQTLATRDIESSMNSIVTNVFKEFDEKGNLIDTACAKIIAKARTIFEDAGKGPYYLARLLTADSNSGDGINGYYQRLDSYAAACTKQIETLKKAIDENKNQKERLADKMQKLGHFNSNLKNYQDLVRTIWQDQLKVKLYERLVGEYYLTDKSMGACYQVKKVLNAYLTYADILTYMHEILTFNSGAVKNDIFTDGAAGSIFSLTDAVFDPLKNSVRHKLNTKLSSFDGQEISNFASALLKNITANPSEWALYGENPLSSAPAAVALRKFVYNYPPFADITEKNFTDYFEAAYKNETDAQKDKIVRCIANRLETDAAPMCNVFPGFDWLSVKELGHQFIILPHAMNNSWGSLLIKHLTQNSKNFMTSPDQNAIYNYTLYAAMPIWVHADIQKYEEKYYASREAGIHINENEKLDPPYTDYPPLLPPQQWFRTRTGELEYSNQREVEFGNEMKTLVQKALDCGVICRDGDFYVVQLLQKRPSEDEFAAFFEEYTDNKYNFTPQKLLLGQAHLRAAMVKKFGSTTEQIYKARNLDARNEENLAELLRRQMKLVGKLKNEIAYVDTIEAEVAKYNGGAIGRMKLRNYFTFLAYGLIVSDETGRWNYELDDETFNITSDRKVQRTSPALENYMEMAAYRAFFELPKADEHYGLLLEKVGEMDDYLDSHFDDTVYSDTIKAKRDAYVAKAESVLNAMKRNRNLSLEDKEIQEFYAEMQEFLSKMRV